MIQVQEVTGVELCFGGDMEKLLPSWKSIPEEFKNGNTKWNRVVSDWFFSGLKEVKWTPKPGIDTKKAVNHISAIMSSFEPEHEHKEAGCAYLMSEFFEDVVYKRAS